MSQENIDYLTNNELEQQRESERRTSPTFRTEQFSKIAHSLESTDFRQDNLLALKKTEVLFGDSSLPLDTTYGETGSGNMGTEGSISARQPPVVTTDVIFSTNALCKNDKDNKADNGEASSVYTQKYPSAIAHDDAKLDVSTVISIKEELTNGNSIVVPEKSTTPPPPQIPLPTMMSSTHYQQPIGQPTSHKQHYLTDPLPSGHHQVISQDSHRPLVSRNPSQDLPATDAAQTIVQSHSTQQSQLMAGTSGGNPVHGQSPVPYVVPQTSSDASGMIQGSPHHYSLNKSRVPLNYPESIIQPGGNQVSSGLSSQNVLPETRLQQQKIPDARTLDHNGRKSRFVFVYRDPPAITPVVQGNNNNPNHQHGSQYQQGLQQTMEAAEILPMPGTTDGGIPLMPPGGRTSNANYSNEVKPGPVVFLQRPAAINNQVIGAPTNGEGVSYSNLEPCHGRQNRPRSEGVLDTTHIYHDVPHLHHNNMAYHRTSYSSDFPYTGNYPTSLLMQPQFAHQNQKATTSSLPEGNLTNIGDNDNLSVSKMERLYNENLQRAQNSSGSMLRDHTGLSAPAGTVVEIIGSIPVVRIPELDGTVKKRIGRFKLVEGTAAVQPSILHPVDVVNESQIGNASVQGVGNSGTGVDVPINQNQSVVRKGRFVVLTMSDPSTVPQIDGLQNIQDRSTNLPLTNENSGIQEDEVVARNGGSATLASSVPSSPASKSHAEPSGIPVEQKAKYFDQHVASDTVDTKAASREAIPKAVGTANSSQSMTTDQNQSKAAEKSSSAHSTVFDSARAIRPTLGSQPLGLGKAMYHLHQMQLELTEVDKATKSLQTENKCLKEKNKELEAKAREWERKFHSEKAGREKLEAKVKDLKSKLRIMKEAADPDCGKEMESIATTTIIGKISRSSSFDGDNDLSLAAKQNDCPRSPNEAARQVETTDRLNSNGGSPLAIKSTIESEANNASPMPHFSGRNVPTAKPPILPMVQKKSRASSAAASRTNGGLSSTAKTSVSASNAFDQVDTPKNGMYNSQVNPVMATHTLPVAILDSNAASSQTSGAPPRPPTIIAKSRSDSLNSSGTARVPGSSLSRSFDPFVIQPSHDSPNSDDHQGEDEEPMMHIYTSVPSFVIEQKPLTSLSPDLIDFNDNSWVEQPTIDTFSQLGMYPNTQHPVFLIHQNGPLQPWESHDRVYTQQASMVTESHHSIQHLNLPRNDVVYDQSHSRTPSISLASSSSPQGSGMVSQPYLLGSEDAFLPLADAVISSDAYQLKPVPASITAENDFLLLSDPFDDLIQRRTNLENFGP